MNMHNVVMIVINNFTNDARVDRAASTLAQNGYSVTVLALKDEDTPGKEIINGYRVERINLTLRGLPKKSAFQIPKYMEFITRSYHRCVALKAHIIHAHDLNALPPAYLASKRTDAKLIYDSHELALERNAMQFRSGLERKFWQHVERSLIKKAGAVITVSPGIARELAKRYHIDEPVIVMNCPACKSVPRQNIIREQLGLSPEDIIILYQGIIAPNRGLEQLVETNRYLPAKYKIVFLGHDSGRRVFLEDKVKELQLQGRVFFLDPVPVEKVIDYAASADLGTCLVNPEIMSHRLTLPNKLFECMTAGTPVITSEAYRDLVDTAGYGRTCSHSDPKAIASTIETIFADPEGYSKMAANACAAARNTYNWQAESRKLLNLYEQCF